ncbi:MAG: VWA domain-containing protein [Candidatus Aureabacteria bacterium]|nr:VWA domain-containing protein [Candidatus Auribacterota bacterium]
MRFRDPVLLILALAIPLLVFLKLRYSRAVTVKFSALEALKRAIPPGLKRFTHLPLALRCTAIFFMVLALARPLKGIGHTRVYSEGIDIILALDMSSSMDARDMTSDLQVNRLDVAKEVVKRFIQERKNDRLGVVAFARYAYMQSPLTMDHDLLIDIVDRLKIVPRGGDEDGTAIGSAIITSVARLRDSKAKSKVIILLTDGMNNYGEISPESAAEVAKSMKIKIYTIGAGTKGLAPYPVWVFGQLRFQSQKIDVDEESLQKIAGTTGAQYYRAQDERALKEIYDRINKMEKVKIEEEKYTEFRELFPYFLLPAFLLLLAEAFASQSILRRLP